MNKKQRWLDCLDNKPIDRPPMSFWHHYGPEQQEGLSCVNAHLDTYRQSGIDMIKMMSDGFNDLSFGVTIRTPRDWARIRVPSMSDPFVAKQLDRIKGVVEAVKDECAVYYVVFSSFTLIRMSWDREMCFAHIKDPDSRPYILQAVERYGDFLAEMSARFITEGGLVGLLPCFNTNGQTQLTCEQYASWQGPQDRKLLAAINKVSNYNVAHFCGYNGIKNNIAAWCDYEAAVAHWDIHTDEIPLGEGRKVYPNVRAIMGGFDNKPGSVLYNGSKQEVQRQALAYAKEGGATGYVLSADCSLSPSIDYQRLLWVEEALNSLV